MKVKTLMQHINETCGGNRSEFGRQLNIAPSQIQKWCAKGSVLIDGELWTRRRRLFPAEDGGEE